MPLHHAQKIVAKNLRRLRRENQYKQTEVAKGAGISSRYYQDIEAGRINVTLRTLVRLALFFKIDVNDLLRGC